MPTERPDLPETRDPTPAEAEFLDTVYDAIVEAMESGVPPQEVRSMLNGADQWLLDKMQEVADAD